MRMVRTVGYEPIVEAKEKDFYILIEGSGGDLKPEKERLPETRGELGGADAREAKETVIVLTSPCLGQGSKELGEILMRSFIFTFKEMEHPPSKILFLNSGIFLTLDESPVLDDLKELAGMGVEILSCGTCLDYYEVKEKLAVGMVTNMYDTVEAMQNAGKCIVF